LVPTISEVHAETPSRIDLVRRGGRGKADIKRVTRDRGQLILKDFSDKWWPVRLLGRVQIVREVRALRRLRGLSGIPDCHGPVGRYGVLMERMEGERITRWCASHPRQRDAMFDRLSRLVDLMHSLGVAHVDLRKRDNILIASDGRPNIIDFNASFCFTPRSLTARLFFPLFRFIDDVAILKWKARLAPDLLTDREWRRHRRMSVLRRLWIFN
jgi:RIO-like serine/threonine protein kinase